MSIASDVIRERAIEILRTDPDTNRSIGELKNLTQDRRSAVELALCRAADIVLTRSRKRSDFTVNDMKRMASELVHDLRDGKLIVDTLTFKHFIYQHSSENLTENKLGDFFIRDMWKVYEASAEQQRHHPPLLLDDFGTFNGFLDCFLKYNRSPSRMTHQDARIVWERFSEWRKVEVVNRREKRA
jgi:hypothetical protein